MRVISGIHRGRKLKSVQGFETRPTADKVKEAAFHRMGPYFDGGICLDLFSGSGSLGIEALSRGYDFAYFIDTNFKAIQTIQQNVQTLHFEDQSKILRMNAWRAIQFFGSNGDKFDLIFVDPPYAKVDYEKLLQEIMRLKLLTTNGLIYCEHHADDEMSQSIKGLKVIQHAKYGRTTAITIYQNDAIIEEN